MRIATFNILHGRSTEDDRVDVDRFATAVSALDADVLALQEVDRDQPRSGGADLTAVAAEVMGAADARFVAALSGTPGGTWLAATGNEQPGSAAYGVALLSRFPVESWQVVRLPALRARVPLWFRGRRWPVFVADEPRVAVAAAVDGPHGRFTVAATHLSFVPGWNVLQLRRLLRSLTDSRQPLMLLGDLNMAPRQATLFSGMRELASALTFPADRPARQLDHVLAGPGLRAAGAASTPHLPVSDHRPLLVPVEPG